jgi:long-chain acyl-CoA synthetase
VECFRRLTTEQPERPAIHVAGQAATMTNRDLWRSHLGGQQLMRSAGLSPGDLIVVNSGNRPELMSLLLAARALDVAILAVDTGATRAEIEQLADRFGAAAIVSCSGDRVEPVLVTRHHGPRRSYAGAAILKLTSGSSSTPRATFTTESQLVADGEQVIVSMRIGADDTQLAVIPLGHSYGLGVLAVPLLLQGTAIILRESFIPHQIADDAARFGARRFPGVPFMFEHLLEHWPLRDWPSGLQQVMSAGAPLLPAVGSAFHERFGVKIHAFYGTSETGGISYDESDDPLCQHTVGRPLAGVRISLREEPGIPGGRIHAQSAAVSSRYVDSDDDSLRDGGFLTGDYGTFDDDGRLVLAGRVSSFINVAGRKVQPVEVESVLRAHADIADVRISGAPDPRRGQQVAACIVRRAGSALTEMAVRQFCSERLAPHKVPRLIVFAERIPVTARGKTDRDALQALIAGAPAPGGK